MSEFDRQFQKLEEQIARYTAPVVDGIGNGADTKPRIKFDDWSIDRYDGYADPIEWQIEPVIPKYSTCLFAAQGGLGKSYLCLDACVRIAAGPGIVGQSVLGGRITERGKSVMITAEDSQAAIHRRLNQIIDPDQHKKLAGHFFMIPLPDAGGTRAYLECIGGVYRTTAEWDDICSEIIRISPDFFVVDPLQAVLQADANDPAAGQAWWSSMSQLCAEAKCASMTTHHMRKDSKIDGIASARAATRGSSSLVDGARLVICAWAAPDSDRLAAEAALNETLGANGLVQAAVVKSNEYGHGEIASYVRDPSSGLLLEATEQLREALEQAATLDDSALDETIAEANRLWEIEKPFSKAAQSDRWVGRWMMERFGCARPVAHNHIKDWISRGYLIQEWCTPIRRNGLRGH